MLEALIDFICGCEDVAFESDFGLDESVRRLAAEVNPPLAGFRPLVSGRATVVVGKVSEQHVSIWCETLFLRNGFAPTFIGYFQRVDKRVVLIGKLGMSWQLFLFFIPVFGMAVFFTLGTLLELIKNPSDPVLWVLPIGGPALVLFFVGATRISQWLSAGTERRLLAAIRSALRSQRTS